MGDHIAFIGRIDSTMISVGTPEENVEAVRKVIDACGTVGYSLAPGKCLLSPSDAKAENLKAINDFVHEYTRK